MPGGLRFKLDFGFWHSVEHDWVLVRQPQRVSLVRRSATGVHLCNIFLLMAVARLARNLVPKARPGLAAHRRDEPAGLQAIPPERELFRGVPPTQVEGY